jgi:hypothetical protein
MKRNGVHGVSASSSAERVRAKRAKQITGFHLCPTFSDHKRNSVSAQCDSELWQSLPTRCKFHLITPNGEPGLADPDSGCQGLIRARHLRLCTYKGHEARHRCKKRGHHWARRTLLTTACSNFGITELDNSVPLRPGPSAAVRRFSDGKQMYCTLGKGGGAARVPRTGCQGVQPRLRAQGRHI